MITYKKFMINEMAEEISLFQQVRNAIIKSENKVAVIMAVDLFIEYQKKYGDQELNEKLSRLKTREFNIDDAKFVVKKAKAKLASVYNWYNDQRRRVPKDISESAVIE